MYNAEQKVFILVAFNRKVVFPRNVDFSSAESFLDTADYQLRVKTKKSVNENTVDTIARCQEIINMIDNLGGKFLNFHRDLCGSTIVMEVSFKDKTSTINFTELCDSYPNFSGRYALTMRFDGTIAEEIDPHDYNHYGTLVEILSEAANSMSDEDVKVFHLNMASLFEFIRNSHFKKSIRDIRVFDDKTEIDIAFTDHNRLVSFEDSVYHWFA